MSDVLAFWLVMFMVNLGALTWWTIYAGRCPNHWVNRASIFAGLHAGTALVCLWQMWGNR